MADVFEVTTPAGVVLVDFDDEAATWSGADAAIACLRKLVEATDDARGLPLTMSGIEPVELVQCCQSAEQFAVLLPMDYLIATGDIEAERSAFYEGLSRATSQQQYAANEMSA
ncbi:hypothetical protein [Comamonas sp. HJ-2]|jgi:hypothetical protein